MTRPTRRSVERRLGELEPEGGLEAEHYLVHGPGIDGFDSMTRAEYVRYCGRVGEERIGEVSAQPLAEGELAGAIMSTLKESYREEPG